LSVAIKFAVDNDNRYPIYSMLWTRFAKSFLNSPFDKKAYDEQNTFFDVGGSNVSIPRLQCGWMFIRFSFD